MSRPGSAAAVAAASFAALAGLVSAGSLTGIDQWANDHAMPWAAFPGPPPTVLEGLVPLYRADLGTWPRATAALVTLPGQVAVSFVLVLGAAGLLRRHGRVDAAVAWVAAWAAGTAIEGVCKHVLVRPPLVRHGVHVVAFDTSWPSGHTIRAAVVALALAAAVPAARLPLALWYVSVPVLLVAVGAHTPSDVAGGLLLAGLLALGARELERSRLLRRRAALRAGGPRAGAVRRRA